MTGRDILSELIQAIVALTVLVPSMLILLYETVNNKPMDLPTVLAGFDGGVITFYFARVGITETARAVANGFTAGAKFNGQSATVSQPPR